MTHGTPDNIACPYCRKKQVVAAPEKIHPGESVEGERRCIVCGKTFYCWFRVEVTVEAERMEKLV